MKKKNLMFIMVVMMGFAAVSVGNLTAYAEDLSVNDEILELEEVNDIPENPKTDSEEKIMDASDILCEDVTKNSIGTVDDGGETDLLVDEEEIFIGENIEQDADDMEKLAAAEIVGSGTCGENLTWILNGDGTLTISGTGNMAHWAYGSSPWYAYQNEIKSITIENGVTSIGENAFYGCNKAAAVTIPSSVSLIYGGSFKNCTSLIDIEIPSSVTNLGAAFSGCSSLTSIRIPSGIANIVQNTFYGCSSLASVEIPATVTSIGDHAFYGCSSLISIEIPSGITSIQYDTFYGCSSLASIEIPKSVTNIGREAFCRCSSLTTVTIPSSVENIGNNAFGSCTNLQEIIFEGSQPAYDSASFNKVSAIAYYPTNDSSWNNVSSTWAGAANLTWYAMGKPIEIYIEKDIYKYTGEQIMPTIVVTSEGNTLTEGADYTVNYSNNIDVGTGTVSITGLNGYGDGSANFQIVIGDDINYADVMLGEVCEYTGQAVEPSVTVSFPTDMEENILLTENIDYTVSYNNNIEVGTGTVLITGIGDYFGSVTKTFIISPRKVEGIEIESHVGWARMSWNELEEADGYEVRYYKAEDLETYTIQDVSIEKSNGNGRITCVDIKDLDRGKGTNAGVDYVFEVVAYGNNVDSGKAPYYGEETVENYTTLHLPLATDFWGFKNVNLGGFFTKYATISSTEYEDAGFEEAQAASLSDSDGGRSGICFGMSALGGELWFSGNEGAINETTKYKDLDAGMQRRLRVTHAKQDIDRSRIDAGDHFEELMNQYLSANSRTQDMVIFKIMKENGSDRHAIYALDYDKDEDGNIKVYVYDPNYANETRILYLNNDESWSYDGGSLGSYSGSSHLETVVGSDGNYLNFTIAIYNLSNLTFNEDNILAVSNQVAEAEVDMSEIRDVQWIFNSDVVVPMGQISLYWVARDAEYTLKNVSPWTKITLSGKKQSFEIVADKRCDVVIQNMEDRNESIKISSEEGVSTEITASMYSGTGTVEKHIIQVTSGSGDVLVTNIESNITMTGLKSIDYNYRQQSYDVQDNITIITDKTISAENLSESKSYCVYTDASEKKSIYEDSKGTGTFDKIVAEEKDREKNPNLFWELDSEGTLRISGTGDMTSWVSYEDIPWYEYKEEIGSVIIDNGITSIANRAFLDCTNLKSVTIPDSVVTIGYQAFMNCVNLTEVVIPAGVSKIADNAFNNCLGLVRIAFEGDMPIIGKGVFDNVAAVVIYPKDNSTWKNIEDTFTSGELNFKTDDSEDPLPTEPSIPSGTPTETIAAVHTHNWGVWTATTEATVFAPQQQIRVCDGCRKIETRSQGSKLTPILLLNASSLKLKKGQTTTAFRVSSMANGDSVKSVTSSKTKILKVASYSANGIIKLKAQKKTGIAKLTVALTSGLSKTITVKVQNGTVKTTKVKVNTKKITLKKGAGTTLVTTIMPITSQQKVTYKTSNKKVATVTSKGVIKAKKAGTAKITIKSGSKKATVTVKVTK